MLIGGTEQQVWTGRDLINGEIAIVVGIREDGMQASALPDFVIAVLVAVGREKQEAHIEFGLNFDIAGGIARKHLKAVLSDFLIIQKDLEGPTLC